MPDLTNDIDELASFLAKVVECDSMRCDSDDARPWIAALTSLVAERDALRKRVAELEAQEFSLPNDPFRDADRDLRERLVCAALTAIVMAEASYADAAEGAVCYADATLAAMRKGESDGK